MLRGHRPTTVLATSVKLYMRPRILYDTPVKNIVKLDDSADNPDGKVLVVSNEIPLASYQRLAKESDTSSKRLGCQEGGAR